MLGHPLSGGNRRGVLCGPVALASDRETQFAEYPTIEPSIGFRRVRNFDCQSRGHSASQRVRLDWDGELQESLEGHRSSFFCWTQTGWLRFTFLDRLGLRSS